MFIGAILIAVGIIAILVKLEVLTGSIWGYTWPVILILLGLSFLWRRRSQGGGFWRGRWCCPPTDEDEKH